MEEGEVNARSVSTSASGTYALGFLIAIKDRRGYSVWLVTKPIVCKGHNFSNGSIHPPGFGGEGGDSPCIPRR